MMKNPLLVSTVLIGLGFAPAAMAADMRFRAAPAPPPICVWCGWYLGIDYGGSIGQSRTTDTGTFSSVATGTVPLFGEPFTHAARGALVGGQVGYNWQWTPNWILGVEVDNQWSGGGDTANVFGCGSIPPAAVGVFGLQSTCLTDEQKLTYFGTARGRLGYATSDYYWYWTGGAAWGTVKDTLNFASTSTVGFNAFCASPPFNCGSGGAFSHTKAGWTIGSGVEVKLNSNWSAKFEYLYVDLGSYTDTVVQPGNVAALGAGTTFTYSSSSHFRDNIIKGGLNYKLW
jgi:outer membrane immunogenic protein